jgi:hypothetical protein
MRHADPPPTLSLICASSERATYFSQPLGGEIGYPDD